MKLLNNLSIMRFAKSSLYSVATSFCAQYSCFSPSKDKKFVINSLRIFAGTISLKEIGPAVLRRGTLHQICSECSVCSSKVGEFKRLISLLIRIEFTVQILAFSLNSNNGLIYLFIHLFSSYK
jgi:hypothetical protein